MLKAFLFLESQQATHVQQPYNSNKDNQYSYYIKKWLRYR